MVPLSRNLAAALAAALVLVSLIAGCAGVDADTADPTAADGDEPASSESSVPGFSLVSDAFAEGEAIPVEHCLDTVNGGRNVSPPLAWSGAPAGTRSFVVTLIDQHPVASEWVHWVVVGLPPDIVALAPGASGAMPAGSRELDNSFGSAGYGGPAPPAGTGAHDYRFTVYALDADAVDLPSQPSAGEIAEALSGHILAEASLTGTFSQ